MPYGQLAIGGTYHGHTALLRLPAPATPASIRKSAVYSPTISLKARRS